MIRKIPKNNPEICGNCNIEKDCSCDCHKEALVNGFHEKIESRPLVFSNLGKIRHFFVAKLKLKVARI